MPLKRTFILVLQEPANVHAVASVVAEADGKVVLAKDAKEALQRLNNFSFDAAVVGGHEVTEALVAELEAQNVPIVVYGEPAPTLKNALVVLDAAQLVQALLIVLAGK